MKPGVLTGKSLEEMLCATLTDLFRLIFLTTDVMLKEKHLCFGVNCYGEVSHTSYCSTNDSLANTPNNQKNQRDFAYFSPKRDALWPVHSREKMDLIVNILQWKWEEGRQLLWLLAASTPVRISDQDGGVRNTNNRAQWWWGIFPSLSCSYRWPPSPNTEKLLGLQVLCVQSMLPFGETIGGIPVSPNNKWTSGGWQDRGEKRHLCNLDFLLDFYFLQGLNCHDKSPASSSFKSLWQ